MTPARIILASLLIAWAIAFPYWLHDSAKLGARSHSVCTRQYNAWGSSVCAHRETLTYHVKADWQDPLAIVVLITGLGVILSLAARPSRHNQLVLAALVIALALGGATWVRGGVELGSRQRSFCTGHHEQFGGRTVCVDKSGTMRQNDNAVATYHYKTDWQDPLAIFVAIAGLGLGAAIIASRPRPAYVELSQSREAEEGTGG